MFRRRLSNAQETVVADKIKVDTYFVTECIELLFRRMKMRRQQIAALGSGGFTLIELLVVVAILGILAAVAIPSFSDIRKKARNSACAADIRTIDKAIQGYFVEKGVLPPDGDLSVLAIGNTLDPWKRPYTYKVLGPDPDNPAALRESLGLGERLNLDYDLYSKGEDGQSGTASGAAGNEDDIVRSGDGSFVGPRP